MANESNEKLLDIITEIQDMDDTPTNEMLDRLANVVWEKFSEMQRGTIHPASTVVVLQKELDMLLADMKILYTSFRPNSVLRRNGMSNEEEVTFNLISRCYDILLRYEK